MPDIIKSQNLDSAESVFFSRELEFTKAKTYDKKYPELRAMSLFPTETDAGTYSEAITYQTYDKVGIAKVISNYADDLPRADVFAHEFTSPIRSVGNSYGYSLQEIRASQAKNKRLAQRKANAAKRAHEQVFNDIAWNGDSENGLLGILDYPNIPKASVPNGVGGNPQWTTKTPDEVLDDINNALNSIFDLTNGVEVPDTIIIPIDQYTYISTTPRSTLSDTTILQFVLKNNPFLKSIEWANELKGAGTAGTDVLIAYKKDPDKLALQLPQPFEQLAVQESGFEFIVPCHSRVGGLIVYYPLSVNISEGI